MRLSIFGLGYVGCTTGACLAEMSHDVLGVEPNPLKVEMINSGKSPVIEEGLSELVARVTKEGRFSGTHDCERAIAETDLAMISVGTPSRSNGSIDLCFIRRVCEEIGDALARRKEYFTIVVRSTVLPGTVEGTVIPILERHSGKKAGRDFGLCVNPEFLREGTSIQDFYQPPKTVIGEFDTRSGEVLAKLYHKIPGPKIRTDFRVAEMVKYTDNAFHALKVAFANEIGNLCKDAGIDSHRVMEIFCQDTKLNLAPCYLKPGFAFGGSCLPKDLRAITHEARSRDIDVPVLSAILDSNNRQIHRLTNKLLGYKGRALGFLGLSFKAGTDDLRSSPIVEVIEAMLGKGFQIRIYDEHVSLARIFGANKEYIQREIPHISQLMRGSIDEVLAQSDVIVVSHKNDNFRQALSSLRPNQTVIDLVRVSERNGWSEDQYYGICW